MAYTIGIDVSKSRLDAASRNDIDQVKSKRKSFNNDPGGFGSLLTWAENLVGGDYQDIVFIVEPTSVYHEQLVEFLHGSGGTVYLVNPGKVRKFAESIGILSKNDVIDADLLSQYGLMARKLIPFEPLPKEVSTLRSFLNRLDTLEKNLRRELNRQEKVGKTSVFHKLEEQSIERFVKHHKTEIKRFKKFIREMIKKSSPPRRLFRLLVSIRLKRDLERPSIGGHGSQNPAIVFSDRLCFSPPW